MNYWPRWINAIKKRTASLSLAQMGAYDRLLDHYYAEEQPLPGTEEECFRIVGAISKIEQDAVRFVLSRYFTLTDAGFTNARADEEIQLALPKIAAAQANGKKGGRPKGTGRKPTGLHDGNPAETGAEPAAKAPHPHSSSSLRSEEPAPRRGGYTAEFEEAWACYPKRAGGNSKADAFKAWTARMRDGATAEAMTTGVVRYAAFCRATGKLGTEFVKQAATFFGPAQHFGESWALPTIQPAGGGQPSALARGLTALAPMVARRDRGQVVDGLIVEAGHG